MLLMMVLLFKSLSKEWFPVAKAIEWVTADKRTQSPGNDGILSTFGTKNTVKP